MADYTAYSLEMTSDEFDSAVSMFKNSIAEEFSVEVDYEVGDFVIYDGVLYQCIAATSAGAWDASKWVEDKIFDNDSNVIINGENA